MFVAQPPGVPPQLHRRASSVGAIHRISFAPDPISVNIPVDSSTSNEAVGHRRCSSFDQPQTTSTIKAIKLQHGLLSTIKNVLKPYGLSDKDNVLGKGGSQLTDLRRGSDNSTLVSGSRKGSQYSSVQTAQRRHNLNHSRDYGGLGVTHVSNYSIFKANPGRESLPDIRVISNFAPAVKSFHERKISVGRNSLEKCAGPVSKLDETKKHIRSSTQGLNRKIIITTSKESYGQKQIDARDSTANIKRILDTVSFEQVQRRWSLVAALESYNRSRRRFWRPAFWLEVIERCKQVMWRWYSLRNVLALTNAVILMIAILSIGIITYISTLNSSNSSMIALSKLIVKDAQSKLDNTLNSAEQEGLFFETIHRDSDMDLANTNTSLKSFWNLLTAQGYEKIDVDNVYSADSNGHLVGISRSRDASGKSLPGEYKVSYINKETFPVRKTVAIPQSCVKSGYSCAIQAARSENSTIKSTVYDVTTKPFYRYGTAVDTVPAWTDVYVLAFGESDILGITTVRNYTLDLRKALTKRDEVHLSPSKLSQSEPVTPGNITEPIDTEVSVGSDSIPPENVPPPKTSINLGGKTVVTAIDMSLLGLSHFLAGIVSSASEKINSDMLVWILEKQTGRLVATSLPGKVDLIRLNASTIDRVRAQDSEHPTIRGLATSVLNVYRDFSSIPFDNSYIHSYTISTNDGISIFSDYSFYSKDISWVIVAYIPRSLFDDSLGSVYFNNILISTVIVFAVSVISSITMTRIVGRPIKRAAEQMLRIANLDFDHDFKTGNEDTESSKSETRRTSSGSANTACGDEDLEAQMSDKKVKTKPMKKSRLKELQLIDNAMSSMTSGLKSFSKYVPMDVVALLLKMKREAVLGVDENVLTVRHISFFMFRSQTKTANHQIFFSDIANFTTISETLPPRELVSLMSCVALILSLNALLMLLAGSIWKRCQTSSSNPKVLWTSTSATPLWPFGMLRYT